MAMSRKVTTARPKKPRSRVTYDTVRKLALALPGMEEGVSYGTPSLKVRGKFMARLREDGETLALRIGFLEREALMASDPETFFITDHYLNYPSVLVRLGKVRLSVLREVLTESWRAVAPRRLVLHYDAGVGESD